MTAAILLAELQAAGVHLSVEGDLLCLDAPIGTITPETRDLVRAHKPALIELLAPSAVENTPVPTSEEGSWPPEMRHHLAMIEDLQVEDLPPKFRLRPGVTVVNVTGFLEALRREVKLGPGSLRARRGLLREDLEDLARVVAGDVTVPAIASVAACPIALPAPGTCTPAEHLAELGGFMAAQRLAGDLAHIIWDAARLWEGTQGTPAAARWEEQYWAAWARV